MIIKPKLKKPKFNNERIAFLGPMCVGKTTLADHLVKSWGYEKLSFAYKLKLVAWDLYGINAEQKTDETRKVLQELADDLKKWDSDLFITHLLLKMERFLKDNPNYPWIVVDDVRFKREAMILKRNGFKLIAVTCDETSRQERISKLYPDTNPERHNHPSEQEWKTVKPDFTIDSTTFDALFELDDLIKRMETEKYGYSHSISRKT